MSNIKKSNFTVESREVRNAKLSKEPFQTTVLGCTIENGSKYKPGHWRDDIYEVETSHGVYISKQVNLEHVDRVLNVFSQLNQPEIAWKWLNLISVESEIPEDKFSEPIIYEIQDALSRNVPNTRCTVYKIAFGKDCYVGFTTQNPKARLEGHIKRSKDGGTDKINKAFRKWGYICEHEILGEYPNEILGLVAEVANIQKYDCNLNENEGGQGRDFNIVPQKNIFGEDIFAVHDKNNILCKN